MILEEVALRKESVDRNVSYITIVLGYLPSLSARRAWIEILKMYGQLHQVVVALRKESVDRNDF